MKWPNKRIGLFFVKKHKSFLTKFTEIKKTSRNGFTRGMIEKVEKFGVGRCAFLTKWQAI